MKEKDIVRIAKEEALSAIESSVAFSSLKSIRDDVNQLQTTAYMLDSRLSRILEIVKPYTRYDEYASLRHFEQSLLRLAIDCTSALVVLDNLIKRGLL